VVFFFLLQSCSHTPPTEAPRDNPLDGRNPGIVPKVLSITTDFVGAYTNNRNPDIHIGTESAYMVRYEVVQSVNTELSSNWEPIETPHIIELSGSDGEKLMGCQALALNGKTSDVAYSVIRLDTQAEINSFSWNAINEDSIKVDDIITFILDVKNDAFGAESGGTAVVEVDGLEPIQLSDNDDGTYSSELHITINTPTILNAQVYARFTDRAGNELDSIAADKRLTIDLRFPGYEAEFPLGETGESIIMRWMPEGEFLMGSPEDEDDRRTSESPYHMVSFAEGFWISKYEVTQKQWHAVFNENPAGGFGVGDDYPVYNVSWQDVQVFLSEIGEDFNLPSEAQWEYACRAETTTRFYWGNDPGYDDIDDYANHWGNTTGRTLEVGSKQPNYWGLYDMVGNVAEWCSDNWHENYENAPDDGSSWTTNGSETEFVIRGGSWRSEGYNCRSASRSWSDRNTTSRTIGFRLVKN